MASRIDKKTELGSSLSDADALVMPSAEASSASSIPVSLPSSEHAVQMQINTAAEDLTRHEIRDRIAHGGMSQLELAHKLATDVYLTDEDRNTFKEGLSKGGGSERHHADSGLDNSASFRRQPVVQAQTAPSGGDTGGSSGGGNAGDESSSNASMAASISMPAPNLSSPIPQSNSHQPTPQQAAAGLAPQGVGVPQGLMNNIGFLGPQGLLAPRSDRPAPLTPQSSQTAPAQTPTSAPTNQLPQNSMSGGASPGATPSQQPAATQSGQSQSPTAYGNNSQSSGSFSPEKSQSASSHFRPADVYQPVKQSSEPLFGGKGHSPFLEILSKFFSMLARVIGLGGGGAPPSA